MAYSGSGPIALAIRFGYALKNWGPRNTFYHFLKFRNIKYGTLVGEDKYGNKYYENLDYPGGQHRWVDYPGDRNYFHVDASEVPADWHLWLHHVTDETPTAYTTGSTYSQEPIVNNKGSQAIFARNEGPSIDHECNQSLRRPRAYGCGNNMQGPLASHGNETHYYTQPGWALDKRHVHPKDPMHFDLTNTAQELLEGSVRKARRGQLAAIADAKARMLAAAKDDEAATFAVEEEVATFSATPEAADPAVAAMLDREPEVMLAIDTRNRILKKYGNENFHAEAQNAVNAAKEELAELYAELGAIRELRAKVTAEEA